MRRSLVIVLCVVGVSVVLVARRRADLVPAPAQTTAQTPPARPQQAPPVFRGATDLVELDVSVIDAKRHPVHGLAAADFTVEEDGQPQRIDAVSEVTAPAGDVHPPVWTRTATPDVVTNEVGDKRLFAVIVSAPVKQPVVSAPLPQGILAMRPDSDLVGMVRSMLYGILDRMGPGDELALFGPCWIPFTDNRDTLTAAFDSFMPGGPPCPAPEGSDAHFAHDPDAPRQQHLLIRDLAEYLGAVPQRRKAIVYIGPGGPFRGDRSNPADADLLDAFWFAQQANVNIYTFDPYELGVHSAAEARYDSLFAMAENTGGFPIVDPTRADEGLTQLFTENGSYYMVGYHTTHPAMDGKFRRLTIKVAGRGDVQVRTRAMLYRPKVTSATATALAPSRDLPAKLAGVLPSLDITFAAQALPFAAGPPDGSGLAVVTEITEPVARGVTHVVEGVDLRVLAYDDRGEVRADVTGHAAVDRAPTSEDAIRYAVLSRLDVPPGRYDLRLVVHNPGTDKEGSLQFDAVVPDFAREAVTLSGLALSSPDDPPGGIFGTVAPLPAGTPTARRTFSTSEHASVFARVYEGGATPPAAVAVTAHLVDAGGTAVLDATEAIAPARFDAGRGADYHLDLPLARLRAGEYLLTIEAAMGAHRTPRHDVRFVVR